MFNLVFFSLPVSVTRRRATILARTGLCGLFSAFLGTPSHAAAEPAAALYRDAAQPIDARVHDLVSRLTLDEKAGLMKNASAGVLRLAIPKYDWWSEALHGVARAGDATVFPQAIGLAAMWDETFMRTVGDTISTEARAKYAAALLDGHAGERYHGLTFWTPNINIFRDPRWGRGQETYGEDPFLTARLGVAFVRGLQGDDPRYLKTAACAKHLAVHSGPESTRYHVNVEPTAADLHETYLPAFEALVREGRVESVMTAYNALYGQPCSVSPLLYGLLEKWGFDGHVVCDCGAVYCIYEKYQIARDFPEAEALAVKAGLSLRCGSGDAQLGEAVRRGLLTEAQLDASLARLLRTQFRLGLFDPPTKVPYTQIKPSENNTPAHAALALDAARKSIVLLKNDGVLPLDRAKLQRVLVVGPNADSIPVLLGNYHGTPTAPVTVLAGLRAALGSEVAIEYAKGCDYAETKPGDAVVPRTVLNSACDCDEPDEGDTTGLQAEFFANDRFEGTPVARQRHQQIEFEWDGKAPANGLSAESFSVRWTGTFTPALAGDHRFTVTASGDMRLYLDRECVLDTSTVSRSANGAITLTVSRRFAEGVAVPIRLEYAHHGVVPAAISLQWTPPPAHSGYAAAVAKARKADAVIFVGGISAQLEGEDMRVDYDGFAGGDRTRIELPVVQQRLFEALADTGKPIVFVNLSGSAIAFASVDARANAIVQAWYPGQAGGTAVAEVLLGTTNPAGRLPVTFYRSTQDLPPFDDYHMANRTYRYFHHAALYPFGHGLSYTTFSYSNLRVARTTDGALTAAVEVTNTGGRDGDEVVQLYLEEPVQGGVGPQGAPSFAENERVHLESRISPIKSLAGFQRVHLAVGARQTVTLPISSASFRRWNDAQNDYSIPAGEWRVLVGASSADIRLRASAMVD